VVTAEDHLAAVARPRLEAARADLDLVRFVTAPITLPDDAQKLGELVDEFEVKLVVLDPLVAFIGDGVNTHRDHHVRRVLAPLADLAERARVALVVVIHTNKAMGTEPLMRISGSIGFTGAARTVLLAADDPQDDNRRILGVVKSNLAEMPAPLAYRVVGEVVHDGIPTSRIEWLGEAPEVDVRELLAQRDPEERTAREEAIEYLQEAGVQEVARQAKELLADAGAMGISDKTLQRARRALRIPSWRDGFQGPYYWGPRSGPNADPNLDTPTLSTLSRLGLTRRSRGPTPTTWTRPQGLGNSRSPRPRRRRSSSSSGSSGRWRYEGRMSESIPGVRAPSDPAAARYGDRRLRDHGHRRGLRRNRRGTTCG
jgi:hypothetical protein